MADPRFAELISLLARHVTTQRASREDECERNYKEWCRITGKEWTPHVPGTFPRGMGLVKTYTSGSTEP